MTVLYFVTPAWERFALTALVLEQRKLTLDFLAERGVDARVVVIADDGNAHTAEAMGLEVLRRPNYALGRRFNDGFEYALDRGAEWVVPIGSDSFLDPAYLFPLPERDRMRSSTSYAVCEPERLGQLRVRSGPGVGPYMLNRDVFPASGRPAEEWRKRGIDGSTIRGLRPKSYRIERVNLHPWQYIGFRSWPQMNSYDKLYKRLGVGEDIGHAEVVERLSDYYPSHLVRRALLACQVAEAVA